MTAITRPSPPTVILLNYARPENIREILLRLETQTIKPEVILINNSEEPLEGIRSYPSDPFSQVRTVHIPWNARPFIRHLFAIYARTEWIIVLDDDLCPRSPDFINQALSAAAEHPSAITGAFGCRLGSSPPYYRYMDPAPQAGHVEIIKGRLMIYRKDLLQRVRLSSMPLQFGARGDDIFLSLESGSCQPIHWVDQSLRDHLRELDPGDAGLEQDPLHYQLREALTDHYVNHLRRPGP